MSHKAREPFASRFPLLVTVRMCGGLPSLRGREALACLHAAFARGSERFGFRLVDFSVQTNHLHLLAEAAGARALARGMQGLLVRVARGLNRLWRRRGAVVDDHYHARILRTPREVRCALVYVLHNAKKHGSLRTGIDPFSSGQWFDGWQAQRSRAAVSDRSPLARARTWLLALGWRRLGLIGVVERPRAGPG